MTKVSFEHWNRGLSQIFNLYTEQLLQNALFYEGSKLQLWILKNSGNPPPPHMCAHVYLQDWLVLVDDWSPLAEVVADLPLSLGLLITLLLPLLLFARFAIIISTSRACACVCVWGGGPVTSIAAVLLSCNFNIL